MSGLDAGRHKEITVRHPESDTGIPDLEPTQKVGMPAVLDQSWSGLPPRVRMIVGVMEKPTQRAVEIHDRPLL
jgi:hypothetical protein